MTAFNVSVDDSSPLISYSPAGAWTDSPLNDQSPQDYSRKTWHTASAQDASATIQFNGTGIWFFGARKPGYGTYDITVDDQSVSGNARCQTASFRQLLGGQSGLANGPHTAVFTNTGLGSAVDLDSIIFETQIGSASATVTNTTTDDSNPAINYLPSSGDWALIRLEGCFNDTLHFTQSRKAHAQFTFDGDAVAVYGMVSPVHANYTVTMDGVKHDFSNGLARGMHKGTLLYFSNSLTSRPHNLTLTANPGQPNTGKIIDIDRIVVFTAPSGTNDTPLNDVTSPSDPDGNSVNTAAHDPSSPKRPRFIFIGALVGGIMILILLLLIVLVVFLIRRRRRRGRQDKTHPNLSIRRPTTPDLPIQTPSTPDFGPLSPTEPKLQDPFGDPNVLEKSLASPSSAVRSAADDDSYSFTDNAVREASVMDARDDRWAIDSRNQSSMSSTPVRPPRPPSEELLPKLGG